MKSLGEYMRDRMLAHPGAYVSIFGPDKTERRWSIDERIRCEAWVDGEYWLTVRKPPGIVLISDMPRQLTKGVTLTAKPVMEWEIHET